MMLRRLMFVLIDLRLIKETRVCLCEERDASLD